MKYNMQDSYSSSRNEENIKELDKYYQNSSQLLEDIPSSKREKYLKQIKDKQKMKYKNNKNRYNQSQSNNDNDNESLSNNKSYKKINNIIPKNVNNDKDIDKYFYEMNNNDNNELYNNAYHVKRNKNKLNEKQKNNNKNLDYSADNCIFTRIVPNFENRLIEEENDSLIPCLNYSFYNIKTYDIYKKKIPKNSNYNYKSKTPDRKLIYHKKKKKKYKDYTYENSSFYSETNSNNLENNTNSSKNNDYDISTNLTPKELNLLKKKGMKINLDKSKKNDYFDLITLNDINNLKKPKKSSHKYKPKNHNNINVINYEVIPTSLTTPTKSLHSNLSDENNNNIDNYNNDTFTYPKRNNYFLENNNNHNKSRDKNKNSNKNNNNKSYDCIVFKKKVGINSSNL
jgi:hypothetical protein